MLKKFFITITLILTFIYYPNITLFSKEIYTCTPIEKVAVDLGYKVSKITNESYELIRKNKYIYAEIDNDICEVILIAKIEKVNPENIYFLQKWNNQKGLIGRAVHSKKDIFLEQTMFLVDAPDNLVALQMAMFEVNVEKFYDGIAKIKKYKI